jgi:hypothetical protein
VTYKHWNGSTTETSTHALGRFYDREFAEHRAQERYNSPGFELLTVRPETGFEAVRYKVIRFLIRSLRVVIAAAMAFFIYAWLGESNSKIGDIPLGDLTLSMIFSALFHGVLLMGGAWLCWVIAFGDGPQDDR